jgi:TonB family protein
MIVSVLIHLTFVMAGVAFFLLETFFEEPEPVVFELVAASAPTQPRQPEQAREEAPPEDVPPLRTETLDPLEEMPEIPEEPPPPPEPEPAPRKIMNFEDWARNRDLPDQVQRVERQERREVETPEIRTNLRERLEQELPAIQVEGMDLAVSENNDALQRYLAQLRQRIEAAFVPSGADLQAEAVFTVTANGRIREIRLKQPSGNAAFDDSVRRALRTARSPGSPPESRAYTFSLVFRSE